MSPRTGRPTDNPKKQYTSLRLSEDDNKMLSECCEKLGKSKSEVVRMGIEAVYKGLKK